MEVVFLAIFIPLLASVISLFSASEKFKAWAVTTGTFLSALLATYIYFAVSPGVYGVAWIQSIGAEIKVRLNEYSLPMGVLVAWLVAAISLYSVKYMEGDYRPGWYWFFFGFFATSMMIIVYADNLWFLLAGWEGVGLASWALIGHWYRDEYDKWVGREERVLGVPYWWTPSKAGLRAILTVRFGDAFFLIAIAIFFITAGTVSLKGLENAESLKALGVIPLLFFALGPFTKSAQFPFHEWLLTAMTGPTSVSALIHAATMVKAGVYVLIVTAPIFSLVSGAQLYFWIVMAIGVVTALTATLIALSAMEFKLVLAGSTAANLGIIAAATGAAGLLGLHEEEALSVLLFYAFLHIVGHAVSKASLFMGFGAVIHEAGTRFIGDVGRLWRHMKITAVAMALSMLSLVGIPPFIGYITKDLALENVFEAAHAYHFDLLLPVLYLLLFITPIYGLRLLGLTFIHGKEPEEVHEAHPVMWLPYTALAVATIALGGYFAAVVKFPVTEALLAVLAGFLTGFVLYIWLPGFKSESLRPLWEVLYRRFYLPILYDGVFPSLFTWFAKFIYVVFDKGLFDGLYHNVLPGVFESVSNWARRLITGNLSLYVLYGIVGILVTLLLLVLI
ncbi:NADH-quinone oxidoreductase subunit L [Pyrobaculum aerophilum]|uniref:NADH-ubiquinone oxidoreductase subunit n=2 Tax=Pyrobaculum aerophilum TaxID=13773 RepID=Q8ZWX9_PYRAE|nr:MULTISPECIES: NADH-quinone oxidoreductase subunit L [Pyrobaculum]AAL63570.1 NADH-ubiquinone oxidoreductase subunit [Pyrobaculum aerophilum str. IM2]MCX8136034.1 NADH-quinone oxidoreductase subunit L [Pyrobaculum aerophilum]HII46437.1 NADH-quinone oxidoreductase subunit L [Pyrobaculum aerophilum]